MNIEQARHQVADDFPFPGYLDGLDEVHTSIASTVQKWLPQGATVLDFGSGPCDKTAVIQKLGYVCSACDDLSDHWHQLPGNVDKIKQFASASEVKFHQLETYELPYPANSFDMVMIHDVLDHLHDSPRELMNKLVSLIKPGGFLFVTLPNAVNIRKRISVMKGQTNMPPYKSYYWHPGPWRGHVREYVKDDLRQMSDYLGLAAVELEGCHHFVRRLNPAMRPAYRVASAIFKGWRDSWKLVAQKPSGWTPKLDLSPDQLKDIVGLK